VEALTIRLMPDEQNDGPHHMAADEVLLQSAAEGIATLRFYTWSRPTLSLGYFQPEATRHNDPLLADLPLVRRPTGGLTLVHHHEQTYCLAVPASKPWNNARCWLRMHEMIAAALATFGVRVDSCTLKDQAVSTSPLCFHHFTPGDLMIGSAKIAGSAQRKQRGAILQHGAILLACSSHTPSLPGILELTGIKVDKHDLRVAIVQQMKQLLGCEFDLPQDWTEAEKQAIEELIESRYRSDEWKLKR
jgi:lipoyl(octanoyl) transferase